MPERPDFIAHWSKLEDAKGHVYKGDMEEMGLDAAIGEKPKAENRIRFPMNPAYEATRPDRWLNPPEREFGPHDGKAKVRT